MLPVRADDGLDPMASCLKLASRVYNTIQSKYILGEMGPGLTFSREWWSSRVDEIGRAMASYRQQRIYVVDRNNLNLIIHAGSALRHLTTFLGFTRMMF